MRLLHYSNWGAHLGRLRAADPVRKAVINGDDALTLSTDARIARGDRLLWSDGTWHEHVVSAVEESHGELAEVTARVSWQHDLRLNYIDQFLAHDVTAAYVLGEILKLTGWEAGECDDMGNGTVSLVDLTVHQALLEIAGTWGCEIEPEIEVGSNGVEARRIMLKKRIGADRGARFDYRWNMEGVTRSVEDEDVFSACYGYGESTGSTRNGVDQRLTFSSINGGLPYVADEEARLRCGVPDGSGGAAHSFGVYENSECSDATQLLRETREHLAAHCVPRVSYKVVPGIAAMEGVELGDTVHVVDAGFEPPIRLVARVGELTKPLDGTGTPGCTFGNVESVVPDVFVRTLQQAQSAMQTALAAAAKAGSMASNVVTDKVTIGGNSGGTLTTGADGELIYTDPNGGIHTLAVPGTGEVIEGGGGQ